MMLSESDKALGERLRQAGVRRTRQRIALARLLFSGGHRHVTAEALGREAAAAGARVSTGTVYNTLRRFARAGLIREVAIDSPSSWFDTNVSRHHHFYRERTGELEDIPGEVIQVTGIPVPPSGEEVAEVNVVVRLKERGAER